jgi:hypothetical protein
MATSLEKLQELQHDVNSAEIGEGQEAMLQLMMVQALPIIANVLPEDPRELDEQLTRCGEFVLGLRSDDYQPVASNGAGPTA